MKHRKKDNSLKSLKTLIIIASERVSALPVMDCYVEPWDYINRKLIFIPDKDVITVLKLLTQTDTLILKKCNYKAKAKIK